MSLFKHKKIVKDLDMTCKSLTVVCPFCKKTPDETHITANEAIIFYDDFNFFAKRDDSVSFDVDNMGYKLKAPFTIGFTCKVCKIDILIEKDKEK